MDRKKVIHQCLSLEEIKAYLNEEISEQERIGFENHFASCALCEEVKESLLTVDQEELEEDITTLKGAIYSSTKQEKSALRSLSPLKIAATILLPIIGFAAFLFWSNSADDRLYEKYYQSY